jgi:hypothetical protein
MRWFSRLNLAARNRHGARMGSRTVALVIGACTFGGALAIAPTALAGTVVLWACHGPAGQGLGTAPFTSVASHDGVVSDTGCDDTVDPSSDQGLSASFSRPDPAAGSIALWQLAVPAGTTLNDVSAQRATAGFGGAVQPSDPQAYSLWTSDSLLESSSLADASDTPLSGPLYAPATGAQVQLRVSCAAYAGSGCAAPSGGGTVGVDFSSIALNVTDSSVPQGAVGGVQSVVAGSLNLIVDATDSGLGLYSLNASLDGQTVASAQLGGVSCTDLSTGSVIDLPLDADCPSQVVGVPISVNVANVPDGMHLLRVTVTDAAGTTASLVNQEIEVLNHPAPQIPSVTVSIGTAGSSGSTVSAAGTTNSVGVSTSARTACAGAVLSVRLSDKPLGISHGRLVLRRGKRYRYRGRLTCLVNGRRTGAPRNSVVDVGSKVRDRYYKVLRTKTNAKGQISVAMACSSTRTIVFSYTSSSGGVAEASLRVVTRKR